MAITNFAVEYESSVAPEKMYQVLIADAPNHHPKILPQIIKSIDLQDGSIITTTYTDGSSLKIRVEYEDSENLTCKHIFLHGAMIKEEHESFSTEWKFEPSSDRGLIIKIKGECVTKDGTTSDHAQDMEQFRLLCKLAEEYVLAHPDVCA
ncbi:hypothetical protein M9H77_35704 [Catharanthus roseus]|uniref:Uncharacterized protein n=1 Tax=Catharanthus roseus TaxID=4058 RepID=A0ACB9ZPS2_CATRO|nr:hypothetical protein M9H77_35704 [Catharanthus roseus]